MIHLYTRSIAVLNHQEKVKLRANYLIQKHQQHQGEYDVFFKEVKMHLHPDVFCPEYADGSHVLADCILEKVKEKDHVLDMGTGSGAMAILAAQKGASVVAVDILKKAVECAQENANRLNLDSQIDVRHSDVFTAIESTEKFSLIVFNPPFMNGNPQTPLETAMYDPEYRTLTKFFKEFKNYLAPNGRLQIVFSEAGEMDYLKQLIESSEMLCETVKETIPQDTKLGIVVYEVKFP